MSLNPTLPLPFHCGACRGLMQLPKGKPDSHPYRCDSPRACHVPNVPAYLVNHLITTCAIAAALADTTAAQHIFHLSGIHQHNIERILAVQSISERATRFIQAVGGLHDAARHLQHLVDEVIVHPQSATIRFKPGLHGPDGNPITVTTPIPSQPQSMPAQRSTTK